MPDQQQMPNKRSFFLHFTHSPRPVLSTLTARTLRSGVLLAAGLDSLSPPPDPMPGSLRGFFPPCALWVFPEADDSHSAEGSRTQELGANELLSCSGWGRKKGVTVGIPSLAAQLEHEGMG